MALIPTGGERKGGRLKPFDSLGQYCPAIGTGEIRSLAARGATASVLSSGLGLVVQVASTVALARMLLPQDFGVVALVSTFSLLLVNFGQNGFTEAVIQREEIDHQLISNLFWINAGLGAALAAVFAACGPLLKLFYHNSLVPAVAVGMSFAVLFSNLSVEHLALLRKAMRFPTVSSNDVVSRIVSAALAIILAWRGWGYRALVAGVVGQVFVQTLGAWYLCRWIPSLPRRAKGTKSMVGFALNVYGRYSINYFTRNVDNLLVGWRFGVIPLGFYKKAYDLFGLAAGFSGPLTNVAVSALSRFKPLSEGYRRHLMAGIAGMALVGMGLSGLLTLIGHDFVVWLLGPRWEPAGTIFTFFGPGLGALMLSYTYGWIHLSGGRPDRWLRWVIVESMVTFSCFVVALPWGPPGIAVAWTTALWLLMVPAFLYALRPLQIPLTSAIHAIWRFIAAAFSATLACSWIVRELAAQNWFPTHHLFPQLVLTVLLYALAYAGMVLLWHRGRLNLFELPLSMASRATTAANGQQDETPASAAAPAESLEAEPLEQSISENGTGALVSILIPAHNAERTIAATLRSAIAQTWEPKEIIVVDDGSTDRTVAIARQFESDTVRIVSRYHEGAAAARNHAFSLSRGEYVQWLDADDLLSPDKIAQQMAAAKRCQNKRIVFTCAFGVFLHRPYRANFIPTKLWGDLSPVEWLVNKMSGNMFMQTGTWLVSREVTEAAGPWNNRLLGDDDGEYFCRVLRQADMVRFVPGARVYYRKPNRRSLSHIGFSDRKREAQWTSMRLHIEHLRSLEDSERTRVACVKYLQHWMMPFYPERLDIFTWAQEMARSLGGEIKAPTLPEKYAWLEKAFGWVAAKRTLSFLQAARWSVRRLREKALYLVDNTFRRNMTEDSAAYVDPQADSPEGGSQIAPATIREG